MEDREGFVCQNNKISRLMSSEHLLPAIFWKGLVGEDAQEVKIGLLIRYSVNGRLVGVPYEHIRVYLELKIREVSKFKAGLDCCR